MISFSCPGCQATFKLPDEMAGKTARCSKCNHRFTVPGGKAKPAAPAASATIASGTGASAAPAPMPPKKAAPNPMPEVLEAEVIDEPAPPPRRPAQRASTVDEVEVVDEVQVVDEAAIQAPPRRGRRPMPATDEDDDDDRRRPSRRARDDHDRDDWDDEDDLDRPRRKRRRQRSGGSKMGVIMASIGGGSFVMMIVCAVGMVMTAQPVRVINAGPPFANQPFPKQPPFQFNPPPNFQPQQNQPAPANAVTILDKQDQLTVNDEFDTVLKRSRSKRYDVQLQAGKTYTIEMIAIGNRKKGILSFDPYLRLELNGNMVALNDDGAGNLNARIVFRAQQTAQHVVIATSLNQATGGYRLTVRESP